MRHMRARALEVRTSAEESRGEIASGGMRLGRIVAADDDRRTLVEFDGCAGPTVARLGIGANKGQIDRAIARRDVAVIVFEEGDPRRPIVLGLVPIPQTEPARAVERPTPRKVLWADVDGRRVRIEAEDEIVLECGKASVTLRRNGKVVIRGTYVETKSDGTNRIKGGQVRIN